MDFLEYHKISKDNGRELREVLVKKWCKEGGVSL
nr:glycosyltransferase [Capnocytophaga sp. oral taxon 323]